MNDRLRAAFLADLHVLTEPVPHPHDEGTTSALHAAELRLRDYSSLGYPSGGSEGRSSDVSDPTHRAATSRQHSYERDRDDLDHALKMAAFHASAAARIVGRMRPVAALDDPPNSACNVLPCPNVPERLVKPKGSTIAVCPRCRKHFERHGRHWPIDKTGRDIRTEAA